MFARASAGRADPALQRISFRRGGSHGRTAFLFAAMATIIPLTCAFAVFTAPLRHSGLLRPCWHKAAAPFQRGATPSIGK
jgi:hypothetical protein